MYSQMFHQSYLVRLFPHGFLPFIVSLMILITWNQKKDRYLPYSASTIAWIFGFVEMELKGIPINSYCSALRICCLPSRASPIWARFCPCGGYGVCWYYLKTSVLTNRLLVRYVPLRFWPSESVYQQTPLHRRDRSVPGWEWRRRAQGQGGGTTIFSPILASSLKQAM